jgi:DNA-directed RNA polymerase subunit RPC12/RpoP
LSKIVIPADPRISKFITDSVFVEGKHIDFSLYEPMKTVYDLNPPELLVLAGRQIGKSVYLASKSSTKSVIIPHNRILYVSPLESQAKTWSKTKLGPIINDSPRISRFFKRSGNNVFYKENSLGSYIELTYASLASAEPARVRGKSADDLYIDETQDIVPDALPVIKETITSSLRPTVTYAGTAKSSENLTGILWKNANRIERVYKCTGCGKYNIIEYNNIGKTGLICSKCGKILEQHNSKFVVVATNDKNRLVAVRLPQVIMPIHQTENKWADVLNKYNSYSPEKFEQEVLGIPSGSGSRFLSLEDLKELCLPGKRLLPMATNETTMLYRNIFMGIDWSGEGTEDKSRTSYLIFGQKKTTGDVEVIGGGIIPPGNPDGTLEEIEKVANLFRVKFFGADAGMGAYQNAILQRKFGPNRFLQVRYIASQKNPFTYDPRVNILNIDKTAAIDTVMGILKQDIYYPLLKKVAVPVMTNKEHIFKILWPQFEDSFPFFKDILAEFSQKGSSSRKIWTHSPDTPDDSLHAIVFGLFAYTYFMNGQVSFY